MSKVNVDYGFAGLFTNVKVVKESTGEVVRELEPFDNLVTNAGLNAIRPGNSNSLQNMITHMAVGTGTSAPAEGNTSLGNRIGNYISGTTVASDAGIVDGNFFYTFARRTYQFNAGTVDGQPIAELGVFNSNTGAVMWSRTLIKDEFGDPTTITLLPDEILVITYEARLYIPDNFGSGTFEVSGVTYNWEARPMQVAAEIGTGSFWGSNNNFVNVNNYGVSASGNFFSPTENVSSASVGAGSWSTYVTNSFERVWTPQVLGINSGNFSAGIRSIFLKASSSAGNVGVQIALVDPITGEGIPKTSDDQLRFTDFITISWGRYVP